MWGWSQAGSAIRYIFICDGNPQTWVVKLEIPVANVFVGEEEAKAVYDVVKSGWLSMGKKTKEFEERFAKVVGAKHGIAVNNGTSALHLALAAIGAKHGDEVILPSLTFISTANVVLYQNARPVLVECDPKTYNVTADIIEKAITKKTKAIIPVDMNGMPADYDEILEIAEKHSIPVIWDSAESLGAKYKGRIVGSIAPIHVFSFFPNKNITTGEGGMITTDNDELCEKMKVLRNQGQDNRYHHIVIGYNYRMTEVQAAIGIEQLKKLERVVVEKQRIANVYNKEFAETRHIWPPFVPNYVSQHAWYMYAVNVDGHRDEIVKKLKERGIDTRLSFPPIHIQPVYKEMFKFSENSLPVTYAAWSRLVNIPIWPGLDKARQQYVIDTLIDICE